jgi:4-carboxymuconolactone decarboxylase
MEKSNRANRFSTEVRARAVRMIFEHEHEYANQSAAIMAIAPKIGCGSRMMPVAYHSCVTCLSTQVGKLRQITGKLCLDCCRDQLLGSRSQQIRQRVRRPVSTRKTNNVSRFHGGVSPSVGLLSHNNKSTRYAANLQIPQTPDSVIARDLFLKGLEQRKATLGAEYVEKNLAAADDFTRPFQEAMTAWCWGFGWGDDVIDAKTRSMMNISMIGALGKMAEWETHCRGAINNGVSKEEIRAIIHVIGIYCGVPQALECFRVARKVLEDIV